MVYNGGAFQHHHYHHPAYIRATAPAVARIWYSSVKRNWIVGPRWAQCVLRGSHTLLCWCVQVSSDVFCQTSNIYINFFLYQIMRTFGIIAECHDQEFT